MGFYATRWVEAADQERAKTAVLEALRSEPELIDVPHGCGAEIWWEEIEAVPLGDEPKPDGAGFTFFPSDQ